MTCESCRTPVVRNTGYIWVDLDAVMTCEHEVAEWTRRNTHPLGGVLVSGAELFTYPDEIRWRAHHAACDPEPDANSYTIRDPRICKWGDLLGWTAHLMGKTWLTHTDWSDVLRGVHSPGARIARCRIPKNYTYED